jgi:hypothetical protein
LEYENNLKAADHPLDSTGNVIASIGSQNQAYLGEISIGQASPGRISDGLGTGNFDRSEIAVWLILEKRIKAK